MRKLVHSFHIVFLGTELSLLDLAVTPLPSECVPGQPSTNDKTLFRLTPSLSNLATVPVSKIITNYEKNATTTTPQNDKSLCVNTICYVYQSGRSSVISCRSEPNRNYKPKNKDTVRVSLSDQLEGTVLG